MSYYRHHRRSYRRARLATAEQLLALLGNRDAAGGAQ